MLNCHNTKSFNPFLKEIQEIQNLKNTAAFLIWDQSVNLPESAVQVRANQIACLEKIIHEKFTSTNMGNLIKKAEADQQNLSSDQQALIKNVKKDFIKANKITSEYKMRLSKNHSLCYQKWIEARNKEDFNIILEPLKENLDLQLEYSSFFNANHPADPHIDIMEPGLKSSTVKKIFDDLKKGLVPLVKKVHSALPMADLSLREGYNTKIQWDLNMEVLNLLGWDKSRTCVNNCIHAFTQGFTTNDVRITTKMVESDIMNGLSSTIHEAGHAFYELGFNPAYENTPLSEAASTGLHESQSRFWENQIGLSKEFWEFLFPKLCSYFPDKLKKDDFNAFYRAINHTRPSLIRTESDELTYDIHVMIRFDLELKLLEGKLSIKDLPEAWNEQYRNDLSVVPDSLKTGVLQDIHWFSDGIGGAFQCYTLGNIMSVQIAEAMKKDIPKMSANIKNGSFKEIHQWLNKNIHCYGCSLTVEEIIKKSCKDDLNAEPYLNYLTKKYSNLAGI